MWALALALLLIVIWMAASFFGPDNLHCDDSEPGGLCVHRAHGGREEARESLRSVRDLLLVTVNYLREKYLGAGSAAAFLAAARPYLGRTPELNVVDTPAGRARVAAAMANKPQPATAAALAGLVREIQKNWNPHDISEGSPFNFEGETAYTVSHGDEMVYCLRQKKWGASLHDFEILGFVALHELAHVFTPGFGHPECFWEHFKWLLHEAQAAGIYRSRDYSRQPDQYCGMKVNHNPMTDGMTSSIWELPPNQWGPCDS